MAENPITVPLPADLPTNWVYGQTVAPDGSDVGLSQQHGYNYLMEQVNAAQQAAEELGEAFSGLASTVELENDLKTKMQHFGNITGYDTVLAAASALTVDGTFFGDPSSSIYNATDKPPGTTDVQYFVMLDGTTGRRVVLAVGYSGSAAGRFVGTRDILNGAWLNEWRELVDTQYLKENYNWLWLSDDVLTESAAPTEYPMGTSIFFSNATWNGLVSATVYTERKTNAQIMQRIYMWGNPNVYYRIGDMQGNWMAWNRIATITSEPSTAGARAISAGTTDLTAGSSSLATGQIYLVYG